MRKNHAGATKPLLNGAALLNLLYALFLLQDHACIGNFEPLAFFID